MRYKKKLIVLLVLVTLLAVVQLSLPGNAGMIAFYNNYVFRPYQSFRNMLFGWVFFSIGDVLYLVAAVFLLLTIGRWIYFLARVKKRAASLGNSMLNALITLSTAYLLFFMGWGGNYYKPKIADHWRLKHTDAAMPDSILLRFDSFLVEKLNGLSKKFSPLSFNEAERRARLYYRQYTDSRTKLHGLGTKPSVFGYFMQYLSIQGYYNPFTGEAQVNRYLPSYMLPFVVCHEMAHQSGVAAEDDANLLAYALGTEVPDSTFRYSAYFNVWLYTHSRLRARDTVLARMLYDRLNPLSRSHIDTLRAIRRKYRNGIGEYSGHLYDGYLRLYNQKNGIDSYSDVSMSAWALEQRRRWSRDSVIKIP